MPNEYIDINIPKAISQNLTTRRAVASSVKTANRSVSLPPLSAPSLSLQTLSNILHKTVSAVITVLASSRPRILLLARHVASRAIFVGGLLILTSLFTIEGIAQQFPTDLTATPSRDGRVTLSWKAPTSPSGAITGYDYRYLFSSQSFLTPSTWRSTNSTSTTYTITSGLTNGREYYFWVRVVASGGDFTSSAALAALPIPAPGLTATPGDGRIDLSWTAPALSTIANYELRQGSQDWQTIPNTETTHTTTDVMNGISYTFQVRAVNTMTRYISPTSTEPVTVTGATSSVTVTPLTAAPGAPGTLNVERVEDTAILTWSPPSDADEEVPIRYEYSSDGGSTWTSTGSTDTTYTVTGLEPGETYTFLVRAVYVREEGNPQYVYISHRSRSSNSAVLTFPKRRVIQECPVGWVRSDGFAERTRRVLLYEVKLQMDIGNPISIYKPDWVAIYVHPDEGLENLNGWKLQVALPYNHHRDYLLTAENSVVVDAEFVDGGFAFIGNPEETPFPMVGVGFTGAPAPGFDYRLYDETGKRVDFGISCYKRGDIFQVLKGMEDPRVLRKVLLESFDWDQWFLRSEWTVPVPVNAPGAPSLQGVNLVGTWADLKKQ